MVHNNTAIFWGNVDKFKTRAMTAEQIISFLEQGAIYRTFSDVLRSVYPGEDLAEKLKTGMFALSDIIPGTKDAENMDRNIRNWLAGRSMPQKRELLFKICFALELDEVRADKVLARASETGIHYRNPRELVYAYALRTGISYAEAQRLYQELEPLWKGAADKAAEERKAYWAQWEKAYQQRRREAARDYREERRRGNYAEGYIGHQLEEDAPNFLTQQVIHQFDAVWEEAQLRSFFAENAHDLGAIHESAYEKFRRLLLTLEQPDDTMASSHETVEDGKRLTDAYSLEKVADIYLRMNVPMSRNVRNFDYLQKAIKKNWPGPSDLQKIKARTVDVDRKTLLLLFIVTEDFLYSEDLEYLDWTPEEADWLVLDETDTPKEQLEIAIHKLNMFLSIYGMNQLDPGNPFDCLVLYAIAAEYNDGFLGEAFAEALAVLFTDAEEA